MASVERAGRRGGCVSLSCTFCHVTTTVQREEMEIILQNAARMKMDHDLLLLRTFFEAMAAATENQGSMDYFRCLVQIFLDLH